MAATRTRDEWSRLHGLATVDREHPGLRDGPLSHLHCARKRKSRSGAEEAVTIVACFTADRYRIPRKYRGRMKKRPVVLAAIEAVTKPDPIRTPDASIRTLPHRQPPVNLSVHAPMPASCRFVRRRLAKVAAVPTHPDPGAVPV